MPRKLLVTDHPERWDLALPEVEVVSARAYLSDPAFAALRRASVFNVCRSYGYQSLGYYVSLLAAARKHRPLPSVTTLQDLRDSPLLRVASNELSREIARALQPIKSDRFALSVYFGRNMARRYDRLCKALFAHFPAPFLRAELARRADVWRLESLRAIGAGDIPDAHREFIAERARRFFDRPHVARRAEYRYDLAILSDPDEVDAPSDERALRRFERAAARAGMRPLRIDRDGYGRLAEFDALFIRATTSVDHYTYRIARRAEAEGLVVVDDPTSIIRCTNKVYLAEVFERADVPCPRTRIVHRGNAGHVAAELGFPCVVKRPDSSFSRGVVKAADPDELEATLESFFDDSELVVVQEFAPSDFDWRVGVLGGRAFYVCKYHMVKGHWQVQRALGATRRQYGKVETLAVADAPAALVAVAERAAALIGDGLYGVDVKDVGGRFLVMEVNDNPSIEGGVEDAVLGDALYDAIMRHFAERLERRGRSKGRSR